VKRCKKSTFEKSGAKRGFTGAPFGTRGEQNTVATLLALASLNALKIHFFHEVMKSGGKWGLNPPYHGFGPTSLI
jgi:hypothetical protein